MFLRRFSLPLAALLALASPVQAEIYKYIDSNGNLVLTDSPPKDKGSKAEKVETRPIMTIPAMQGSSHAAPEDAKPAAHSGKYTILIQSPEPNATIQRVEGDVPLAISVTPQLLPEHSMQVLLDGTVISKDGSGSLQTNDMERGAHTLTVKVTDQNGKVLASQAATFYIQQPTVLGPNAAKPRKAP